ncbi:DUF4148 domain-containing protein [Caballeronia glathei]|jgi:hypothetical protein|nr:MULTISPECIES: DUF4148 domain-containing protein [Burkholderiaceae]
MMKMSIAVALFGFMAATSAFAQSSTQPEASPTTNVTTVASVNLDQTGQWVPPDSLAIAPETRAQVYHELVKAEKDGQLAYLDSTLYAHH